MLFLKNVKKTGMFLCRLVDNSAFIIGDSHKSERRLPARLEPANSQRALSEVGTPIVNGAGFAEVSFDEMIGQAAAFALKRFLLKIPYAVHSSSSGGRFAIQTFLPALF
jgi:hypothetical protein